VGHFLIFQFLPAMGAGGGVSFIGLAAIKAGVQNRGARRPCLHKKPPSLSPGDQIKREENDKQKKNAYGPKEALPNGVVVLLGIEKNPESDEEIDKKEKEFQATPQSLAFTLSSFARRRPLTSFLAWLLGTGGYFFKLSYHARFFWINSGMGKW